MNNLYQQLQAQMNQNQVAAQQQQQQQPQQKLFSQAGTQNNNFSLLNQIMRSSNPKEFIQNMIMNNPKMQSAMQSFQNSNLTPKQFFYQYAKQKGVNPEQFIKSL